MARTRRRYTDDDRATALAVLDSNNGNLTRTAREVGIAVSTLQRWIKDRSEDLSDLRNQKRESLSELWEQVARAYIARALQDAVVDDTAAQSAVTVAAIATDKKQLLSGQPTEINRHEHNERATPDRAIDAAATALRRSGIIN